MEITVNIKCPDLALAAAAFAKALAPFNPQILTPPADVSPEAVKEVMQSAPAQIVTESVAPAQPENPTPGAQQSFTPAAAMTAPAPTQAAPSQTAVPTSPAPQITGDMVAKAGADLIAANPANMGPLNALLQKYGVSCAQELRPDQIGPFATEMRALGAKI
jgi:hypothetical protein